MSIKKNFLSTLSSQVFNLFLTFGVNILMLRAVGIESFGEYSYYYLIVAMLVNYSGFGIIRATLNVLKKDEKEYNAQVISTNNLFINFLLVLISLSGILLVFINSKISLSKYIIIIISMYFGHKFELEQRLQLFENNINKINRAKNISNIVRAILFLIGFLLKINIVEYYLSINMLQYFIKYYFLNTGKIFVFEKKISYKILRLEFKIGILIFLSTLCSTLNLKADQFIIKQYLGMSELGVYSSIAQISESLNLISNSISVVILGYMYNNIKNNYLVIKKALIITFIILSFISSLGVFFSSYITLIYGQSFFYSISPLKILLIASIFQGLRMILDSYFYKINKIKINLLVNAVAAALNICLNYILIEKYRLLGVAFSSLVSYVISFLILFIIYKFGDKNE